MARKQRKTGAGPPRGGAKLTPEVSELICEAVRCGNYKVTAARLAKIDRGTLDNWERWGKEDPDSIYGQFEAAIRVAEAEAEAGAVSIIMRAAAEAGQWQAAAWMCERKWGKRWRQTTAHDEVKAEVMTEQREKLKLENEKLRLENDLLKQGGSTQQITIVVPPVPSDDE